MTQCIQQTFGFHDLGKRQVVADFQGGNLSADGGVVLLREVDSQTGFINQIASCFTDFRAPHLITHSVPDLLRQRILGIALGYEDLNDHDTLRHDPAMALGVGKEDPLGLDRHDPKDKGKALAGKSTLNRLELTNAKTTQQGATISKGDHKIRADHAALEKLMIKLTVNMLSADTKEIILDFDATDSLIHGDQKGKFFHGYYGDYCFLPLYCFIGPWPVWAQLRTSDRDACDGATEALEKIVPIIRERFPEARVILRADSGFAREKIFAWCEEHKMYYITGLARNKVLEKKLEPSMFWAKAQACLCGGHFTEFCEFMHETTSGTWSRPRRVIGKAQVNPKGENPRFIVTNIPEGDARWPSPRALYEKGYCARGDMENRIKEQQLELFSDRMSCAEMESNQLRLWFSTFAYTLLIMLREKGLQDSKTFAVASPGTIRERLLKIATQVKVSVRRVVLNWSSSFRFQSVIRDCCARLQCVSPC